jgi:class 3 adenylate cyclase
MADLPRGTVTFVFTDIEGSTELLKRLGERYREILGAHRRIVRETFSAAGGMEIDTHGDAFFFVFGRARDAVAAAVDVQRLHAAGEWPEGASVRVRIGLHTGEPAVDDEGYLGLDVVRAARICTVGRGGQVLLSETTRALVGTTLPEGVAVFPLGERHLRGLDEPERVYELAIEDLETETVGEVEETASSRARKEASAGLEGNLEKRFEDLGARLAAGIQERVLGSLERTLGKPGETSSAGASAEASDVEVIASRAAALEAKITARVEKALREKGISRGREE